MNEMKNLESLVAVRERERERACFLSIFQKFKTKGGKAI